MRMIGRALSLFLLVSAALTPAQASISISPHASSMLLS
jgi:hypothetical protein